jgi:hypothetical protein
MPIPVSTQALEVFNLNQSSLAVVAVLGSDHSSRNLMSRVVNLSQSFLAVVAVLGSDHSSRNLMSRVVLAAFQDFQNLTSRRVLWVARKRRMSGDSRRMRGSRRY